MLFTCLDMAILGGIGAITCALGVVGQVSRVPDIGRVRTCVLVPTV